MVFTREVCQWAKRFNHKLKTNKMEKGQYIKFRYGGRLFNIRVKQNTINKSVEENNKLKEKSKNK